MSILPLRMEAAVVRRRGVRLLGPVDFTLNGGGLTVVLGPNGAGKTTFLRLMHGLERPREGRVAWAAPDVEARRRQAYVFQTPIMMRRSVEDSIAYPLRLHGASRRDALTRAAEEAGRVGLADHLKQAAASLSGGEKQKLALARALIRRPEVLFLDEPCANLDGRATREIEEILARARQEGTRLVMATHDLGQARRLADDVAFLLHGKLQASADAPTFFSSPPTPEADAFLQGRIVE